MSHHDTTAPGTEGMFVAVFPYLGGWSTERIRRNLRPLLVILATDQHANLTGEVTFHLENTAQGAQVVVASAPAVTTTPAREVREHAADVAGALQLPLPHLAAWMRAHLTPDAQEAAA